jgi:SAM-dependent methyltransferase
MFDEIVQDYNRLEPPGTDAWNPLTNEWELWNRVRLFIELRRALRLLPIPIEKVRVLDVGCGTGRSSLALIFFGVKPENILGIDLRPSAVAYAKSLNPAINFQVVKSFKDWPPVGSFDLCMQCVAFSSIHRMEERKTLAEQMERTVGDNGYIFWWDRKFANPWAGGDALKPKMLFKERVVIMYRLVPLCPTAQESMRPLCGLRRIFAPVVGILGYFSKHVAALFGPKFKVH